MSSADILSSKSQMRRFIRQKLRSFSPYQFHAWGLDILDQLRVLPLWQDTEPVLCFASTQYEPDTFPLLNAILQTGRPLCLPRQTSSFGEMEAHIITDLNNLVPGAHGILEPDKSCPLISPQQIQLILAPCLAAGLDGSRLGHGAGCYDRFFALSSAFRAVLCPNEFMFEHLPVESTDQPIQQIITESDCFCIF